MNLSHTYPSIDTHSRHLIHRDLQAHLSRLTTHQTHIQTQPGTHGHILTDTHIQNCTHLYKCLNVYTDALQTHTYHPTQKTTKTQLATHMNSVSTHLETWNIYTIPAAGQSKLGCPSCLSLIPTQKCPQSQASQPAFL